MTDIEVRGGPLGPWEVTLRDAQSSSSHRVRASPEDLERYAGSEDPQALIEASFRFLLAREPAQAILSSFELSVIEQYFPEYPAAMAARRA